MVITGALPATAAGKPGSTVTLSSKVCKQLGGSWIAASSPAVCQVGSVTLKNSLTIPTGTALAYSVGLTVKSGLTVTIANGGELNAQLAPPKLPALIVSGTISNQGVLDIGPLTVNSGGHVNNGANAYFEDGATGPNAGSVQTINAGGFLDNTGVINMNGTVHNYGTVTNESAGELDNEGSATTSTFINESGSAFQNSGTFSNFHMLENASTSMFNDGTFTNWQDGGSFTNDAGAEFDNFSGTYTNAGATSNEGTIQLNGMTFSNSGTFTTSGSLLVYAAAFTNTGTFTNTGSSFDAVYVTNTVIDNQATLNNQGGIYLYVDGTLHNESGASVTNSGTVSNDGTVINDGTWTNTGNGACNDGSGTGCPA